MSIIKLRSIVPNYINESSFFRKMMTLGIISTAAFLCNTVSGEVWNFYGKSMDPAIPATKESSPIKIEVEKIPWNKLEVGMIVVFKRSKYKELSTECTTHRLFKKIDNNHWWTKGDANKLPDNEYVTPENYCGVVIGIKPKDK